MTTPLDDIKFLANSSNRVRVLSVIDESPCDRQSLHDATGIPQSTLGRILNGFQDRGWITREGTSYRVTEFGHQLAQAFGNLENHVETQQKLHLIQSWFDVDEMEIGVEWFKDAAITTSTAADPTAPWRRADLIPRTATRLQILASVMLPQLITTIAEGIEAGDLTVSVVNTADVIELMHADPDIRSAVRRFLASGQADLYRYEGTFPDKIAVVDNSSVVFGVIDSDGRFLALVECDHREVVTWANERFETYLSTSTPLTIENFPA